MSTKELARVKAAEFATRTGIVVTPSHGVQKKSDPTPPGNSDGYQNKGDARRAIRNDMKAKD
jgi:hypothetical protein